MNAVFPLECSASLRHAVKQAANTRRTGMGILSTAVGYYLHSNKGLSDKISVAI